MATALMGDTSALADISDEIHTQKTIYTADERVQIVKDGKSKDFMTTQLTGGGALEIAQGHENDEQGAFHVRFNDNYIKE